MQRTFVPPPAQDSARRLDDVRGARREVLEGDRLLIEEPGRVIIQQGVYVDRPYTLDEIRYSLTLRERMPRVDLDTVLLLTQSGHRR